MGLVNPKIPRRDVTLVPNFCLHNQSFLSTRSVYVRKMSSDSEMNDLSERSSNTEEGETEEKLKRKKMKPLPLTKTSLWLKLTLETKREMQMTSRKGNLKSGGEIRKG